MFKPECSIGIMAEVNLAVDMANATDQLLVRLLGVKSTLMVHPLCLCLCAVVLSDLLLVTVVTSFG